MLRLVVLIVSLCVPLAAFAEDGKAPDTKPVEQTYQADAGHGKEIFASVCMHCHTTTYELSAVGCPGLKGVLERHSAEWINTWLISPEAFAKKDEDAKIVVKANPYGLIMPTLPEMQNEKSRQDIIAYLKTLK
jgi:cytochrome c2